MRIIVHIPDNLAESLKMAALNEGLSISAMTARALTAFLKEKRKQANALRMYALIGPDAVSQDALESLDGERADDRA
ncbi:MAG: hypothetical protein V1897_17620 [Pseudomonadota bacterium]